MGRVFVAVRDWDLAAPHLILGEAGGVLADAAGDEIRYRGSYVKSGLIAAANSDQLERVATWYSESKCTEETI